MWMMIALTVLVMLGVGAIGLMLARSIEKDLAQLADAAQTLSAVGKRCQKLAKVIRQAAGPAPGPSLAEKPSVSRDTPERLATPYMCLN